MAKFFKVIVDIVLIALVAAALALFVPPLFGYATNVVDEETASNMDLGSVTYSRSKSADDLSEGDQIIQSDADSFYVYEIKSLSSKGSTAELKKVNSSGTETIKLGKTVQRYLVTIPFIGYISIALQTTEGMIVLGLAVLLLIILLIVLEVWSKKKTDAETAEEEEDDAYFAGLRQSKEEIAAEVAGEPSSREARKAEKKRRKEEKKAAKAAKAAQADEQDTAEMPEEGPGAPDALAKADEADSTAAAETAEEQAPAVPQGERPVSTDNLPDVQAALEAALSTQPVHQMTTTIPRVPEEPEEEAAQEIPSEIELAIPVRSLDSYLDEAYSRGDDPHVKKDDVTGIRLVDYSDCL